METLIIKNNQDLVEYKNSKKLCNLDLRPWEGLKIDMRGLTVNECYMQDSQFKYSIDQSNTIFEGMVYQSRTIFEEDLIQSNSVFKRTLNQSNSVFNKKIDQSNSSFNGVNHTNSVFKGKVNQSNSEFFGALIQDWTTFKELDQTNSIFKSALRQAWMKCKSIKRNRITEEEIDFLRKLNPSIIEMAEWQSNSNWEKCKTEEELHTCGTTYCIRGYAEALHFIREGVNVEDPNTLLPNLKHLFYLSKEEALKEIYSIIKNS